jgi:hypothetical protein
LKTVYSILFCALSVGFATAQQSKFVEVNVGTRNFSNINKAYKLGLPSFSFAASIGRKMSIKKNLTFSYQFGIIESRIKNSINQNRLKETTFSNISASAATKIELNINKNNSVFAGIQFNKSIVDFISNKYVNPGDLPTAKAKANSDFNTVNLSDMKQYSSNVMLGFTHTLQTFHNRLSFSIQYNLGFAPYQNINLPINQPANTSQKLYHGVQIGLIYKY